MSSSAPVNRSVTLPSPIKITKEEASRINIEKQGIVSILGKDLEITKSPPSLRRTFSADMSSKNFLSTNGMFSPMKRIASSEALAASSSEGDDEEDLNNMPDHDDIWRSIQSQKEKKEEVINNPTQLNSVWSSILSEKPNNEANNNLEIPPPYVHPLVKKSSTLNEKSLEICTESLGSETGSDDFSYPNSEAEDDKQQKHQENEPQMQNYSFEEVKVAKYNYDPSKKMAPKAFPPHLPSLASKDGPSLHMQSHRINGRLVLEVVSVPQRNYFQAERHEGRLVLTLLNSPDSQDDDKVADFEDVFGNLEEIEGAHEAETDEDEDDCAEDEEEDEEDQEIVKQNAMKKMAFFMEQSSASLPTSGMLNVHRSALMMKSLMGLGNRDPTWSNKLNKAVELMEEQLVAELTLPPIPQSLPPQPRLSRFIPTSSTTPSTPPSAMSLNAYDYFWRNNKNTFVDQEFNNKSVLAKINNEFQSNEQQENIVIVKGNNGDCLVPFIKGCKENRRSLLSRQPHCIATS
ncbi:hypothetical protein LIER_22127 [Lithospermum erythrorhizon]|uniref:FAF domain-containing protein n=1 Tax=Lithospermum erythrorhizon TaxID=34254 RepID=A0AAV3QTU8_LITER